MIWIEGAPLPDGVSVCTNDKKGGDFGISKVNFTHRFGAGELKVFSSDDLSQRKIGHIPARIINGRDAAFIALSALQVRSPEIADLCGIAPDSAAQGLDSALAKLGLPRPNPKSLKTTWEVSDDIWRAKATLRAFQIGILARTELAPDCLPPVVQKSQSEVGLFLEMMTRNVIYEPGMRVYQIARRQEVIDSCTDLALRVCMSGHTPNTMAPPEAPIDICFPEPWARRQALGDG